METLEQLKELREELSFKLIEANKKEAFGIAIQLDEVEAKIEELEGVGNG